MTAITSYSNGVQALQRAEGQLNRNAQQIAESTTGAPDRDLTDSLVGLDQAKTYALSGIKVIEARDNVLGALIDIQV